MSKNLKNAVESFGVLLAFLFFITLFFALFTGCQTATQRKEAWLQTEAEILKQRDNACYQNIKHKHEKDKDVLSYMDPWLDSDADNVKGFFNGGDKIPTDYEVKIIIGIYNDIAHCRAELIQGLERINSSMVPIYVQAYRASDLTISELIGRKISWKEAQERKLALDNETERQIRAEVSRLEKDSEMLYYADPANQQAAIQTDSAALSIRSQKEQALTEQLVNQRMMNEHPVCIKTGDMYHCR
jgi:hypothetical protein